MPFVSKPLSSLPHRAGPATKFDVDEANAILAIVMVPPPDDKPDDRPTATDDIPYGDEKSARTAANKYRRMLLHVLPVNDDKSPIWDAKTLVYPDNGAFRFAVYAAPFKARKPRTPKAVVDTTTTETAPETQADAETTPVDTEPPGPSETPTEGPIEPPAPSETPTEGPSKASRK